MMHAKKNFNPARRRAQSALLLALFLVSLIGAAGLSACGNHPKKSAAASKKSIRPALPPDGALDPAQQNNLVVNPSFERWRGGMPDRWKLAAGTLSPFINQKNQTLLQLNPSPQPLGARVSQVLQLPAPISGKHFEASAQIKCDEKIAYLNVFYMLNGQQQKFSARHSGTGQWRSVVIKDAFPKQALGPVIIRLDLHADAKTPALFDQISFRLLD